MPSAPIERMLLHTKPVHLLKRAVACLHGRAGVRRDVGVRVAASGIQTTGDLQSSPSGPSHVLPDTAEGMVMSSQANYYRVRLDSLAAPQTELLCKARSLLQKKGVYVLVGDRVEVMNIDWRDARALVCGVKPRRTEIHSPKAANVDHFAVVFSIADPPFEAFQATRFLVSAASIGIKCSLVLNKCDLVGEAEVQAQLQRAASWGYTAVAASVQSGLGMQELREVLKNRTSVLAGPSGVGKSSIINYLRSVAFDNVQHSRLALFEAAMAEERHWRYGDTDSEGDDLQRDISTGGDAGAGASPSGCSGGTANKPSVPAYGRVHVSSATSESNDSGVASVSPRCESSEQQKWKQNSGNIYGAQAVSNIGFKSRRGRHTTRTAVLLDMPEGGLLLDTPGFNYPSMEHVTAQTVQNFFPEIVDKLQREKCQFQNCTHVHEPGCIVRGDWERYEYYVRVRDEILRREEVEMTKLQMSKRRRQGMVKRQTAKDGTELLVARIDSTKRREGRSARKVQVQRALVDDSDDEDDALMY